MDRTSNRNSTTVVVDETMKRRPVEMFKDHEIKPRKFPNQNILHRLRRRELFSPRPGAESFEARQMYTSICPTTTVVNVEKPNCFLRKFTPCGRYLIAFSSHQNAVEIYEYLGGDAAGQFLNIALDREAKRSPNRLAADIDDGCEFSLFGRQPVDVEGETERSFISSNLFAKFFRLKHTVRLTQQLEQLNRECSLFTIDGKYLIVAASLVLQEEQIPRMVAQFRNNESITPHANLMPEDYWIYVVDIRLGQVMDTRRFRCDRIYLAHNQGLCLFERTLAILSVQQQTIYLFRVDADGHLIELQTVGRYLYDDDEMSMNAVMETTYRGRPPTNIRTNPSADPMLNGLKQRIMAFLYRRAAQSYRETGDMFALRNYYRFYDFYRWLRIWRMQLIDEKTLLIRFASEDVVTMRIEASTQMSFFVFYDIKETKVMGVYESVSEELLELYEKYYDDFRGFPADRHVSTFCNSSEARRAHKKFKDTILNAKHGGHVEAIRRILMQLPISAQSFNPSPYLDMELFSYDDKWVSFYERPRPCSEYPISFHGRKCGKLKFKIQCGPISPAPSTTQPLRSLVAFIFHPFEPFAISVHRNNRDYVVNFHIRYDGQRV